LFNCLTILWNYTLPSLNMRLTKLFLLVAAVVLVLMAFTPQSTEASRLKKYARYAAIGALALKSKKFFIPVPIPIPIPVKTDKEVHVRDPWW
jgi:hypothetical protein